LTIHDEEESEVAGKLFRCSTFFAQNFVTLLNVREERGHSDGVCPFSDFLISTVASLLW
jgi:hypothetical protein